MKSKLKKIITIGAFVFVQQIWATNTNITVNPLGLLLGAANVGVEFKLTDSVALGPQLAFAKVSSGINDATGLGAGVKADFYLSSSTFSDSWVLSPSVNYFRFTNNSQTASGLSLAAIIGYSWFWPSGFNMNLGFGIQYLTLDFTDLGLASVSGTLPAGNFSLGWAF